jgi:septation ring formation regulator EzrA
MLNPTVEIKLEDVLVSIQKDLKEIRDDLTDLKVSQAEIRGDIKVLDEKVTGIGKRLENQEFVSKGILGGLLLIVLGGAAKYFGFVPKP